VVALLEDCDVTNNCRHLCRHLGFYQELEIFSEQFASSSILTDFEEVLFFSDGYFVSSVKTAIEYEAFCNELFMFS